MSGGNGGVGVGGVGCLPAEGGGVGDGGVAVAQGVEGRVEEVHGCVGVSEDELEVVVCM